MFAFVQSGEDLEEKLLGKNLTLGEFALESYDAVWVAALALQRSLQVHSLDIDRFDYGRDDFRERIFEEMSHVELNGVSGPILFEGADRVGTSAFQQFKGMESWILLTDLMAHVVKIDSFIFNRPLTIK